MGKADKMKVPELYVKQEQREQHYNNKSSNNKHNETMLMHFKKTAHILKHNISVLTRCSL